VADICTYSHADDAQAPPKAKASRPGGITSARLGVLIPSSLESAFVLDAPGEYEVHQVLVTGVRTFRDDAQGAIRGLNTTFVYELDGLRTAHLGDVGHMLDQEMVGEMGAVDIVCLPLGSALSPARAAELVAQLDAELVVPLPVDDGTDAAVQHLERFLREMSVAHPVPVPRLTATISTMPAETTVVVLENKGRS
jgi:L-ascorbate metabolism protein UlaG (beta-lactamase superfamily)